MKRVVLAFLLSLAGAAAAQENSGLDALTTRDDLRGWEPVGRVDIADGGFCTGALIAADLVLTAAHCVVTPAGEPIAAARITFRAGYAHGTVLAESGVARTLVDAGYIGSDPSDAATIARDVALLELATPIPSAVISPFVVARAGDGDEVSVVSYAEGREEALSWQRLCRVLGRQDGLIAVDCEVSFGSSGAPVLQRTGYRPQIVSIISAGGSYEGRPIAFGMELADRVDALKAGLRRGDATSRAEDAGAEGAGIAATVPSGTGMPGSPGKRITPSGSSGTGAKFLTP